MSSCECSTKGRKCPNCGNTFYTTMGQWAYQLRKGKGRVYYCSWSCMRKAEKEMNIKRRRRTC